jgi:hypothetical protein
MCVKNPLFLIFYAYIFYLRKQIAIMILQNHQMTLQIKSHKLLIILLLFLGSSLLNYYEL